MVFANGLQPFFEWPVIHSFSVTWPHKTFIFKYEFNILSHNIYERSDPMSLFPNTFHTHYNNKQIKMPINGI